MRLWAGLQAQQKDAGAKLHTKEVQGKDEEPYPKAPPG